MVQNIINGSGRRPGYKERDTAHKCNTEKCPTYASLAKRRLRLWRKSETNARENGVTGQAIQNGIGAKDTTMESEI